jgi:hypothetical protein
MPLAIELMDAALKVVLSRAIQIPTSKAARATLTYQFESIRNLASAPSSKNSLIRPSNVLADVHYWHKANIDPASKAVASKGSIPPKCPTCIHRPMSAIEDEADMTRTLRDVR